MIDASSAPFLADVRVPASGDHAPAPLTPDEAVGHPVQAVTGSASPLRVNDSWWTVAAASVAACALLGACVWVSLHLRVDPTLHTVALFAHLACLVLGFGAVLVADYFGLLWVVRRCTGAEAVASATRLHLPIWVGLVGLTVSGTMLQPDLSSTITQLKLALVGLLTVNGVQAGLLMERMKRHPPESLPARVLAWGTATAVLSQLGWWGATGIGFLNHQA